MENSEQQKTLTDTDRAWFDALESIARDSRKLPPEGEGWKSTKDLAEMMGSSTKTAQNRIRDLREMGKLEIFEGRDYHSEGCSTVRKKLWYRIKR